MNDRADEPCIKNLARLGVKMLLLRSAGFNHVDLVAAAAAGISVRRVPAYSPFAVAEMAVGLLLALVRKIPRAYDRVRNHNFSISGLEGFDIRGKTIGRVCIAAHLCVFTSISASAVPARTHTRTPTRTRTRKHACACAHAHAHERTHTPTPTKRTHECVCLCSCACTHARARTHAQTHACAHGTSVMLQNKRFCSNLAVHTWAGIVGTGKIGQIATKILSGFSPGRLIGYDVYPRLLPSPPPPRPVFSLGV